MAELILEPLIKIVIQKAGDSLVQQIGEMWGVDDQRERIQQKLLSIQAILANAEDRSTTCPAVKSFLLKLRSDAYDADDVLDEFRYEKLRQDAVKAGQKTRNGINFYFGDNPVMFRYKMSKKLKNVVRRIDDLVTEMNKFKIVEGVQVPAFERPRTYSYVEASEVVGRDVDKETTIELLLDEGSDENITILPVVGMGGLGKTTLAQLVCNDHRVKQHFGTPLWVCVSDEFNVALLAKSIIELVEPGDRNLPKDNVELLQRRLREVLDGKRYLIVLDDVWNENIDKWEQFKALLGCGGRGSAIIVTTRSSRVASIMGTKNPCSLSKLSSTDMWTIFKRRAFGMGVEKSEDLVKIGEKLVERCCGSPLAAKALGALMSSKNDVGGWQAILDRKETWGNTTEESGVLDVLRLSYNHLPPYTNQCFVFCTVYPKDYVMDKDVLIHMWMANGFIPDDGTTNFEEKGNEIFNHLVWGSFFQDIEQVSRFGDPSECCYRSITRFKMHDLMHDLGQSVSRNQNLTLSELSGNIRKSKDVHNLLMMESEHVNLHKVLRIFPNIRTLLSKSRGTDLFGRLSKSNSLRVIQTNGLDRCANIVELNKMKHLRYLDFKNGKFTALPESITTLYNLETLDLRDCYSLTQLPFGMRYMVSLRHLYIDRCWNLECMPPGLGDLSNLRTLTRYIVTNHPQCGLSEIKSLNLGGTLRLFNLKLVGDATNAKETNLLARSHINILKLNWGIDDDDHDWDIVHNAKEVAHNAKEVMKTLAPSERLRVLEVQNYYCVEFPLWMSDYLVLKNLIELRLVSCEINSLPAIWQLPSLQILELKDMPKLTHFYNHTSMNNREDSVSFMFPALKMLYLQNLERLEKWEENSESETEILAFPHLLVLEISNCPKLIEIPKIPLIKKIYIRGAHGLIHSLFTWLSIESRNTVVPDNIIPPEMDEDVNFRSSLGRLDIESFDSSLQSRVSQLPLKMSVSFSFLETMVLIGCSTVVFWPEKEFQSLNCLKRLEIIAFANLTGSSPPTQSATTFDYEVLPQLENLTFTRCPCLVEFPKRTSLFLKNLYLSECDNLTSLLETLDHLETLIISGMNWESIPLNLECLLSLKSLEIQKCSVLVSLSDTIGSLTSLCDLIIERCYKIAELPPSFRSLKRLEILSCPELEKKIRKGGEYVDLIFSIPTVTINRKRIDANSLHEKIDQEKISSVPLFPIVKVVAEADLLMRDLL